MNTLPSLPNYRHSIYNFQFSWRPYSLHDKAYELRLVDDYESEYCPDYDMGPLTADDEFG